MILIHPQRMIPIHPQRMRSNDAGARSPVRSASSMIPQRNLSSEQQMPVADPQRKAIFSVERFSLSGKARKPNNEIDVNFSENSMSPVVSATSDRAPSTSKSSGAARRKSREVANEICRSLDLQEEDFVTDNSDYYFHCSFSRETTPTSDQHRGDTEAEIESAAESKLAENRAFGEEVSKPESGNPSNLASTSFCKAIEGIRHADCVEISEQLLDTPIVCKNALVSLNPKNAGLDTKNGAVIVETLKSKLEELNLESRLKGDELRNLSNISQNLEKEKCELISSNKDVADRLEMTLQEVKNLRDFVNFLAVTLSLAFAMKQLMDNKALVRTFSACETMCSATCICTDKTGTLTTNHMVVTKTWICGEVRIIEAGEGGSNNISSEISENVLAVILQAIFHNTGAEVVTDKDGNRSILGTPTESAIVKYGLLLGGELGAQHKDCKVLKVEPFNSEKKKMSTPEMLCCFCPGPFKHAVC